MATVPLSEFVSVSIAVQSAIQSKAAFGTPLIIDSEYIYGGTARVLEVGNLQEMIDAGYASYNRAYEMARTMFAQRERPKTVKIGQWNDGVETITDAWTAILAADPEFYWVCMTDRSETDINLLAASVEAATGLHFYYAETGDAAVLAKTPGNVALDLKNSTKENARALYNPQTAQVSTITFAAATTGGAFTGTLDGNAINEVWAVDNDTSLDAMAASIQAFATVTTAAATDEDGDGTKETITITSAHPLNKNSLTITADFAGGAASFAVTTQAQAPLDAGVVGYLSTITPGTKGEAMLPIKEPLPANLTAAQRANLIDQNVGYFVTIGSKNLMGGGQNYGKVAAGTVYSDIQTGKHWLTLKVQEEVISVLPVEEYTAAGIEIVVQAGRRALAEGAQTRFIRPSGDAEDGDLGTLGYIMSAPAIGDVSAADKAARLLDDVTFQARAANKIQSVIIRGSITL